METTVTISRRPPPNELRLYAVADEVATLGPSPAVGIWTQGCSIGRGSACEGCMSSMTWPVDGGVIAVIEDVAAWIVSRESSNLTISGGEPFDQAPALARLVDAVREVRSTVVTAYSGYRRGELEREIRGGSRELLARLDLLIDGRYRRGLHGSLLWRGSSNQRIHNLSGRVELPADQSAGLQVSVEGGAFAVMGVPAEPDWTERFEAALPDGVTAVSDGHVEGSSFPFPVTEVS